MINFENICVDSLNKKRQEIQPEDGVYNHLHALNKMLWHTIKQKYTTRH